MEGWVKRIIITGEGEQTSTRCDHYHYLGSFDGGSGWVQSVVGAKSVAVFVWLSPRSINSCHNWLYDVFVSLTACVYVCVFGGRRSVFVYKCIHFLSDSCVYCMCECCIFTAHVHSAT